MKKVCLRRKFSWDIFMYYVFFVWKGKPISLRIFTDTYRETQGLFLIWYKSIKLEIIYTIKFKIVHPIPPPKKPLKNKEIFLDICRHVAWIYNLRSKFKWLSCFGHKLFAVVSQCCTSWKLLVDSFLLAPPCLPHLKIFNLRHACCSGFKLKPGTEGAFMSSSCQWLQLAVCHYRVTG